MSEINWNNPIPVLGIEKLVPELGCLVQHKDGEWVFVDWRIIECHIRESGYTPILPRVPEGKTCWDVLRGVWGGDDCQLEEHEIWINAQDDGLDITPYTERITERNYPAHMRDMQKYGALLKWIKANEVKHDQ